MTSYKIIEVPATPMQQTWFEVFQPAYSGIHSVLINANDFDIEVSSTGGNGGSNLTKRQTQSNTSGSSWHVETGDNPIWVVVVVSDPNIVSL